MNALMVDGWNSILLLGITFAAIIYIVSRKVTKKFLIKIAGVLSLICFVVLIYSIIGVAGWEGLGLGVVTLSVFIGIWLGTIIGAVVRK